MSLDDYVLAGRRLTVGAFVATLVPSFYGGTLGVGEFAWRNGLSNWLAQAAPYYLFAAFYALFLAGKVRLTPGRTVPDHVEAAYGRALGAWAAVLVFLLANPADELLMAGALSAHLLPIGLAAGMALAAALSVAVVWAGGLPADVRANRVQFLLMFGGFAALLPFAWKAVGGPAALAARLPAGHLSWLGGMSPWRMLGWWLIAVWTIVDPSFHQRCAAAATPRTAKVGILVSILCWAVFDLMTTSAGLAARALLPDLADPVLAFPALADRVLPQAARAVFYLGLFSSILASLQSKTLLAAVTLGKDERSSRLALLAVAALAFALAWALPSVVGLWYAIGSAIIPGLLLPLLGVYWPRFRPAPSWAAASSGAGWAASTLWLAASWGAERPLFGIEPMFPGLALSTILWFAGLTRRRSYPPSLPG